MLGDVFSISSDSCSPAVSTTGSFDIIINCAFIRSFCSRRDVGEIGGRGRRDGGVVGATVKLPARSATAAASGGGPAIFLTRSTDVPLSVAIDLLTAPA